MKNSNTSQSTRVEVSEFWEIVWEIDVDRGLRSDTSWKNSSSKYSSRVHKIVNTTIPKLWEQLVAEYLWWTLHRGIAYDVSLDDERKVEVKTGRIWSSASIREWQLERLSEQDLYAIVYYETTHNRQRSPSFYVDRCIANKFRISPEEYLRRNIKIKSLFIIQRPSIVYFFNMSDLRLFHNSSWVPYKSLSRKSAISLFDENPNWFQRQTSTYTFWRHEINIFKMWDNI